MSTNEPSVPIVCDECETETRVPLDDLADALERHNAEKHGGESVAEVDPAIKDRLADLVAEDLGLFDEDAAERPGPRGRDRPPERLGGPRQQYLRHSVTNLDPVIRLRAALNR